MSKKFVDLSLLRVLLLEHTPNKDKRAMLMRTKLNNYVHVVVATQAPAVPTRTSLMVTEDVARTILDTPLINEAMRELEPKEQATFFNDVLGVFVAMAEAKDPLAKLTKAESRAKRKAIKRAQAENRYKGNSQRLQEAMSATDKMIIFIDVEWYEHTKGKVTEIGYTLIENGKHTGTHHIIIKERLDLRNTKFVPDNKDNFNFGTSMMMSLEQSLEHLRGVLVHCDYIMGHGVGGDITVLTHALGHEKRQHIYSMFEDKIVVDTIHATKQFTGHKMGIRRCLEHFNIKYSHLHNAGNDTHYNWLVAQELAKI